MASGIGLFVDLRYESPDGARTRANRCEVHLTPSYPLNRNVGGTTH